MKKKLFSITASDCKFITKRGSGKGGQKKNKTSSVIQCFHDKSGAMGECEDFREQSRNKQHAFKRMTQSKQFQSWLELKTQAALGNVVIEETSELGNIIVRKLDHEEV